MSQFADPEKPEVIGCTDAEEVIQNGFAQQAQQPRKIQAGVFLGPTLAEILPKT